MRNFKMGAAAVLMAAIVMMIPRFDAQAETFVGSNIDSRVIVGISANSNAVQEFLPDGWMSVSFPSGPLKGSNLLVSFVDGVLMVDAEAKPLSPASRRALILLGLAKENEGDAVRIYVMRVYTTEAENDPYDVNVAAEVTRTNSLAGPANGGRESADIWSIAVAGGDLAMSLKYTTGKRSWSSSEALSYSAARPEFHRIYRYDSVTDLVMSTPIGKPMTGEFSLTSSVPELVGIFDGDEEVIAILDIPVRVREIYLP